MYPESPYILAKDAKMKILVYFKDFTVSNEVGIYRSTVNIHNCYCFVENLISRIIEIGISLRWSWFSLRFIFADNDQTHTCLHSFCIQSISIVIVIVMLPILGVFGNLESTSTTASTTSSTPIRRKGNHNYFSLIYISIYDFIFYINHFD